MRGFFMYFTTQTHNSMTTIFPTLYSTLLPSALATMVSCNYNLPDTNCSLIMRGVSDTYMLTAGEEKCILKIYRSSQRTYNQIKAEMELLLTLKEHNVSISWPLADSNGEHIIRLNAAEGERYAVVFTFARGKVLGQFNDAQMQSLGDAIGRFHEISSKITLCDERWNYNFQTTLHEPLKLLQNYFTDLPEEYQWLQETAARCEKKLTELGIENFPKGYCHFDFLPLNFHFDGDNVTLFDFDFLGYGCLVSDIMSFRVHLMLDVNYKKITTEEAEKTYTSFLSAYGKHRSLSENELAAVPYLMPGWWLYYMGFYTTHDQFYTMLQPTHLKVRVNMIRQLVEQHLK